MKSAVYNMEGKEIRKVELPESVFGLPWNADLVHQVVVSMQANARLPVAHTKGRGEVRGGGRKPWRQKGTGQARHGSRRSPIWRGGGITFGPRNERDYTKKINRKMRGRALRTVLSRKFRDGELLLLDAITLSAPKTKEAHMILDSLAAIPAFNRLRAKKDNRALFALSEKDEHIVRSFRNMKGVEVIEARNLNPVSLLSHKYVVLVAPERALAVWGSVAAPESEAEGPVTQTSKKKRPAAAPKVAAKKKAATPRKRATVRKS